MAGLGYGGLGYGYGNRGYGYGYGNGGYGYGGYGNGGYGYGNRGYGYGNASVACYLTDPATGFVYYCPYGLANWAGWASGLLPYGAYRVA